MNGYSFFYSSLAGNCRLTLETWEIEFPDAITELNKHNKNEDWERKATGTSVYLDTFYGSKDEGWYSGLILSTFRSTLSKDDHSRKASFRSYEALLRFGYKYNLSPEFAIEPWFAAGPIKTDGKEPTINGERFRENKFQVISTVHMSYKFK